MFRTIRTIAARSGIVPALILWATLTGCSSSGSGEPAAETARVQGNWDFVYAADGTDRNIGPELLEIEQDGEILTVIRYPVDGPPTTGSGTASGDTVSFSDDRLSLEGTLTDGVLSGTWIDGTGDGTWSAVRIPDGEPVVLINLGDSLTNGVQSAAVNEFTQINGFTQILAEQMDAAAFTIWRNPLLSVAGARIDPEHIPFNLGVDGATTRDVLHLRTGDGNAKLDALLAPIPELAGGPVSQLEAAEYLAGLHPGKRKVVTLWIGNNDVLGAVIGGTGTRLSEDAILAFLSDTETGRDLPAVAANLTEIVDRLAALPDTEVLVANLPDVTQIGFLLTAGDLERLAVFPDATVTALAPGEALGFGPFLNPADPSLSVARALSSNNAVLNGTILATRAVSESFVLTPEEAAPIRERVAALNALVAELAATRANVHPVDVNGLLARVLAGEITVDGNHLSRTWGGGVFSLDGVHLSHTGYALAANEFVEALNSAMPNLGVPELDAAPVWERDPYRDRDGDGYVYGPEFPPVISPNLLPLADCDDTDPGVWPTYISGMPCP